jgi:hypothetical protein
MALEGSSDRMKHHRLSPTAGLGGVQKDSVPSQKVDDTTHCADGQRQTVQLGRDERPGQFAEPWWVGGEDPVAASAHPFGLGQRPKHRGVRPKLDLPHRYTDPLRQGTHANFLHRTALLATNTADIDKKRILCKVAEPGENGRATSDPYPGWPNAGDPRKREYGPCAWPGLAELRLRPPAIAPSGSGAGRIIPGVADGPSAAPLSQTHGQAGAFQTLSAGPHRRPHGEHRGRPWRDPP